MAEAQASHAGKLVRQRREALGWSRQQLATRVGCNQNSILKAEGRQSWGMLRVWFALRICNALDLNLDTVYAAGGDDEVNRAQVTG